MKKLTYLTSALAAVLGFSSSANAEVSVSGSGAIGLVNDGAAATNNIMTGAAVSFGLSTTTANGVGISMGMGISQATTSSSAAVTGGNSVDFAVGGATISVGAVDLPGVGVGAVGGVVGDMIGAATIGSCTGSTATTSTFTVATSYTTTTTGTAGSLNTTVISTGAYTNTFLTGTGCAANADISVTEGDGFTLSTSVGGASLTVGYLSDSGNDGDVDLTNTTGSTGASLSMPMGDMSLSLGYANAGSESDIGGSLAYAMAGGTLSLGYGQATLDAGKATTMSGAYSMSIDGDTSLSVGYTNVKDADDANTTTTELNISRSLGGGASLFLDAANKSGDGESGTAVAIGTALSF